MNAGKFPQRAIAAQHPSAAAIAIGKSHKDADRNLLTDCRRPENRVWFFSFTPAPLTTAAPQQTPGQGSIEDALGRSNTRPEEIPLRGGRNRARERVSRCLLLSGLYRRPRTLTGSCAFCACGLYRRSGIGRFRPHPAPKACLCNKRIIRQIVPG
jgi:hypothetical protein